MYLFKLFAEALSVKCYKIKKFVKTDHTFIQIVLNRYKKA